MELERHGFRGLGVSMALVNGVEDVERKTLDKAHLGCQGVDQTL